MLLAGIDNGTRLGSNCHDVKAIHIVNCGSIRSEIAIGFVLVSGEKKKNF
jgi:hypothetical protein